MSSTIKSPAGRVVILGSGWGAYKTLLGLDPKRFDVVCVSPRNHFVFTPLLASTAVGTLEFRAITEPIRSKTNTYYSALCNSIDFNRKEIHCTEALEDRSNSITLSYDYLVISVGARSNTFNIPGVQEYAMFLKEISHARAIRRKIIESFEYASEPNISSSQQCDRLHFCVVGGGPTGIEFSGELYDFIMEDLKALYPELINKVRITVYDVADRILGGFDSALQDYAVKKYTRKGIEIATRTIISSVSANEIMLENGVAVPYGVLVWATGITSTPLASNLQVLKDKTNRIMTDDYLQVLDPDLKPMECIYALGDCAAIKDVLTPATAQIANQKGNWLSKHLNKKAQGISIAPFKWHNMGMMVYTSGWSAIADFSKTPVGKGISGKLAWLTWRSAYFSMAVSTKNKVLIPMYWFLTWMFGRDISKF